MHYSDADSNVNAFCHRSCPAYITIHEALVGSN
jgi:hypothetical protein